MYSVDKTTFNKILKRKFNSLVGNSCELVEDLFKQEMNNSALESLLKKRLKKYMYNAMREIDEQVDSFDKGTKITVNLTRPDSKQNQVFYFSEVKNGKRYKDK